MSNSHSGHPKRWPAYVPFLISPCLCLLPPQTTVRREIQLIPSLIFAMEQFEKFLIQLSKKSKVRTISVNCDEVTGSNLMQVNLMETFKRSMSRDFRINQQALGAIMNEEEGEEGEGEEGEEEEGEGEGEQCDGRDSGPPRSKRQKL